MIIGITGYGGTGASAYIDLIREFENVQYYKYHSEFQLLQQPDGIRDLRFNLIDSRRRVNVNTAIKRFIRQYSFRRNNAVYSRETKGKFVEYSEEYINSLIQIRWKGKSIYDPQDVLSPIEANVFRYPNAIIRKIASKINPTFAWPPAVERYYSGVSEESFVCATKRYLTQILEASGFDLKKNVILEQLFCIEHPLEGSDYFDGDVRSIIVDRDPRDVFLLTNGFLSNMCTFMPNTGSVEDFVLYYKEIHGKISNDPRVCYVKFEDLIFNYDETVKKMELFLGIKHIAPKTVFRPEWSINNTQVFKKYPEHIEDIKYIEANLSDYLYDFDAHTIDFQVEDIGLFDTSPGDQSKAIKKNQNKMR